MRSSFPDASLPAVPLWLSSIISAAALLGVGCNRDEVSHYRAPKEPTAIPLGMSAEAPSPSIPKVQGTLKWTLPTGWTEGEAGGMRYATLKPPIPGKVEATVIVLPGPAGGELSNVNRWRGQIGLEPIAEKALASARRIVPTKAGPVAVFDFTSEGPTKGRVVGALLSTPDGNTWFLKLAGDAGPVGKAQPAFMRLLGSLRID